MHWQDDAIVLSARPHGETSVIASLLTMKHGRHAGLVRGGAGRRYKGLLQAGNEVRAEWRARLPEQLGTFALEMAISRTGALLDQPEKLICVSAACAMIEATVPEREEHGPLFRGMRVLLEALEQGEDWPAVYVRWELGLLAELGFGLDLTACAASGQTHDLTYVSPRSGRAVSSAAAIPYAERLLALPAFLAGKSGGMPASDIVEDIWDGLVLTGFFIDRFILGPQKKPMPSARMRLADRFSRKVREVGVKPRHE